MKTKNIKSWIFFILVLSLLLGNCSKNRQLIKQLPPDDSQFLSEVRFLITRQEKKLFLNLMTDSERKKFKEEFWKKRDPNPVTPDNSFKEEYYNRIEKATKLFREGKRPGWLTDRGRVYILLGPPETKRFFPGRINIDVGESALQNLPHEVWYYGFFPIIFVDKLHNNSYSLTTVSARHLASINKAQMTMKPTVEKINVPMNFSFDLKNQEPKKQDLTILIPYINLLFEEQKESHQAKVKISIKIRGSKKKKIKDFSKAYTIKMKVEDLKTATENHKITIPLDLPPGKFIMTILLEDKLSGKKLSKKSAFKL